MEINKITASYDYNNIPPGYYDRVYLRNKGVQSKWHHMKFKRIREEIGNFRSLLDIGCSGGTLIGTLPEAGFAVGVDVASDQVDYARKIYGSKHHQFHHIQPGILPFDGDRFDVVTIVELIEHLTSDRISQLLSESYRVLRPGGTVLVSTPNYSSLWPFIEAVINRLSDVSYEDQHITCFNKKRLKSFLGTAGFTQISVNAYIWLAPFFASIGWRLADFAAHLEFESVIKRFGLLLLGKGIK